MPSTDSRQNLSSSGENTCGNRLQFLTGTPLRGDLLEFLRTNPSTARMIRDELDVPDSTLHRNLTKLENQQWITEDADRTYHLTPLGELIVSDLACLKKTMSLAEDLSDFIELMPISRVGFPTGGLRNVEVTVAETRCPYTASNRLRDLLVESERFELVVPYYNPKHIQALTGQARDSRPTGEVLLPADQLTAVRDVESSAWRELRNTSRISIRRIDRPLQFGFGTVDDRVVVAAYRDGVMRALLEGENGALEAWIGREIESRRAQSVPLQGR